MVTGTRQILDSSASDQDHAVLLKVVTLTRNVTGNLDSVGKTHSRDLTKRRVRLLRCRSLDCCANTSLLRAVVDYRLLMKRVKASQKCRSLRLALRSLSAFFTSWLNVGILCSPPVIFVCGCCSAVCSVLLFCPLRLSTLHRLPSKASFKA